MSKKQYSRSRAVRNARKRSGKRRQTKSRGLVSIHRMAINLLREQLQTGHILYGWFHGGVTWRGAIPLIQKGVHVTVRAEAPLKAAGRRYIPDLVVHCAISGRLLLAIEVWHTHAVSTIKRLAYQSAGIPWIEVRAWAVIYRRPGHRLPVLDWGGIGAIETPNQLRLFESTHSAIKPPRKRANELFSLRSSDWRLPEARAPFGALAGLIQ
ncbi:MAG: hypothetical protein KF871_02040 [Hydrogenophaga sp.]|uniref:hypothetical protein n=1 Tax=Hydrogenophaga sp. TaxID=1904254 RepID=UPI001D348580|nr:hypothetical protein [Hydrogenophaga sp.]MBX3608650.1 hypothetical protein [Hydrogenophaga sp.]